MPSDLSEEIAKETVKESFKAAKEFAGKLVNPGLEEGGGIIQDRVKLWRFKNQINILLEAKRFLEEKGLDPKKVLPKTLIPLLEYGSLEEEKSMQDRWAALLANAADPRNIVEIKPSYPEILKELSPLEAQVLDNFFNEANRSEKEKRFEVVFDKTLVMKYWKLSSENFDLMMDNLFRLNLCQPPASHGGVSIGDFPIVLRTYSLVSLTPLGYELVKSCRFK